MIYGLNFNGTTIPPGVKRKFREKVRVNTKLGEEVAYLKGVAQSPEERDAMLMQANTVIRKLHVEERKTAAGIWYGIYAY